MDSGALVAEHTLPVSKPCAARRGQECAAAYTAPSPSFNRPPRESQSVPHDNFMCHKVLIVVHCNRAVPSQQLLTKEVNSLDFLANYAEMLSFLLCT